MQYPNHPLVELRNADKVLKNLGELGGLALRLLVPA